MSSYQKQMFGKNKDGSYKVWIISAVGDEYAEHEGLNKVFRLTNGKVFSTQLRKVEWRTGYGFVRLGKQPYIGCERLWHDESDGLVYLYGQRLFGKEGE